MPRIPYADLTALPAELQSWWNGELRLDLNLFRMMAHSHGLVRAAIELGASILGDTSLDPKVRELVILATAQAVGAKYEQVQHEAIAASVGVTDEQINELRKDTFNTALFTDQQSATIAFTKQVVATPKISEEMFNELQRYFAGQQVVELLYTIGYYWMIGRLMTVLEIDLDEPKAEEVATTVKRLRGRARRRSVTEASSS